MRVLLALCLTSASLTACVIDRKAECVQADACDQALDEPFGDFAADDPIFGAAGTCWQTEESAAPCVQTCNTFRAQEALFAQQQGRQDIVDACGGVDDGADEEEEADEE